MKLVFLILFFFFPQKTTSEETFEPNEITLKNGMKSYLSRINVPCNRANDLV